MGISGALNASLSGLSVTRAQLDVLATNIANVDTPGYTRKSMSQSSMYAGTAAIGVRTESLDRQLDALLQKQVRSELGASGYTDILAGYHDRLNTMLGTPGSASAFDTLISNFSTSLSALTDNPASFTAQQAVLGEAQVLVQSLNSMSQDVQILRTEAEQGIATSVRSINDALQRIEEINTTILSVAGNSEVPADLLDERDRNIDLLAKEIDIQVIEHTDASVSIFTNSGISLFDGQASALNFDQVASLNPYATYSSVPSERSVGTVTIGTGAGDTIDLLAGNNIRGGALAGYVEMRDDTLVQMQDRLDEFAHQLALAMSTQTQEGVALNPVIADTNADLAGTGTFAAMDFTNGGANDGSISFDLTVDGVTQTVDITFAEASLGAADPAAVTQAELVALINQEANTAFSTVGATYAVADGTAIDLRSGSTGAGSNVSVASYTEANLSGTSTLGDGSVVGGSAFDGLQADLTGIRPGNQVTLNYTDTVAGTDHHVTFVHVTDPSVLPLPQDTTTDPNDLVIGVDMNDPAAVTAALAANGIGMTAAAGAGGALQFIDDGAAGQYDISALSAQLSVTTLQSGEPGFPMFTDGVEYGGYYSGSQDGSPQKTGFAGRIQVSGALLDDPSALSRMDANTPSGDKTRAEFLYEQFNSARVTVDPDTGIGAVGRPLETSIAEFGRQIVNKTAFDAASAKRADDGQKIVTNGLLARQSAESAVNIDEEMARLTELQSVYAANAQVMSAAREMMDLLLNI
ncbi:MAG: flagellar hook-associated protein FlgK [Hyphomicrobiales bacterium]